MKVSAIVLAVSIGAGATWLWQNREAPSALDSTSQPTAVVSAKPTAAPVPDTAPPPPPPEPAAAEAAQPSNPTPVTPPPANASGRVGDDTTYEKMLAYAQSQPPSVPGADNTTRDITQWRQSFLATPDDPDWARKTEQSIWDFFQKKSASGDGPQVTSVSCRSSGCEVQALSQPFCGGTPCELQQQEARRAAPENVDPLEAFRASGVGNLPVSRVLIMQQPIGDRAGIIVTYRRTALRPEVLMP